MADKTFAQTGQASEWDDTGVNKTSHFQQTLPSSSDESFWGKDSHKFQADVERLTQESIAKAREMNNHSLRIEGKHFVCTSCPYSHTLPLSTDNYTLDIEGKLITIDKSKTQ